MSLKVIETEEFLHAKAHALSYCNTRLSQGLTCQQIADELGVHIFEASNLEELANAIAASICMRVTA